jgi:hypothetical protein
MAKKPAFDRPSRVIPAFTIVRGEGGWQFVHLTLDENWQVMTTELSQADMKPIAIEKFKIEVGKYWGKLDEQLPIKI